MAYSDPGARPSSPPNSLNNAVFGQCELQLHDFQHAVRNEPKTRNLLRLASKLSAAGLLGALGVSSLGHIPLAIVIGVFSLALLAVHQMPEMQASRWYRRTPAKARSVRYTVNTQGLIVVSELAHQLYPWRQLYAFEQTALTLLIWVSPKLFLIVPKRAFEASARERVSQLFLQHVGSGPKSRGQGVRWLMLFGVAAAIWYGWQQLAPR